MKKLIAKYSDGASVMTPEASSKIDYSSLIGGILGSTAGNLINPNIGGLLSILGSQIGNNIGQNKKIFSDLNFNNLGTDIVSNLSGNLIGSSIGGKGGAAVGNIVSSLPSITSNIKNLTKAGRASTEFIQTSKAINSGKSIAEAANIGEKAAKMSALTSGANIAGLGLSTINRFLPNKKEYTGSKGNVTKGLDTSYDLIKTGVQFIPGVGLVIGAGMEGWKLLGKGFDAIGGGTDGMTTADAVLGSSFLKPLTFWNGLTGSTTNSFNKNNKIFNTIGADYLGSNKDADIALGLSNKKYGGISHGSYKKAQSNIYSANAQLNRLGYIYNNTINNNLKANTLAEENKLNVLRQLEGNNFNITSAKNGSKLEINSYTISWKPKKLEIGGPIEFTRDLNTLISYAKEKNPRFIQRMSEPFKYIELNDGNIATHLLSYKTADDGALVYPLIQEDEEGNLKDYKEEAFERAMANKNFLFMSPEEAELFTTNYKKGWENFFNQANNIKKHKEGGKMNVIPEGSLHARLHHMDVKGITKKGIPVISEDGGIIKQLAEIECNEIIFTLEVTKELERLSKENTDEAAIKAGKLLVEEILENTDDRTGLIELTK